MAVQTYQMSYFYELGIPMPTGAELQPLTCFISGGCSTGNYPIADDGERTNSGLAYAQLIVTGLDSIGADQASATVVFGFDELLFRFSTTITITADFNGNDPLNYRDALLGLTYLPFILLDTVAPADLTICTECIQSNQEACGETYFIEAGLTSGDTYYAAITDRNNDVYTQAIMADANGNLTIDALAPEFPTGFWLAESGNKSITVYEDEEMTIVSELTVGANVYTCMILSLQYIYVTTTSLTPDFSFYVSDTLEYYVDQSSNSYISS